jgi:hypothetical protein
MAALVIAVPIVAVQFIVGEVTALLKHKATKLA